MFFAAEKSYATTVSEIIELQKSIKTIKAKFVQEKHSELFSRPVITEGIFLFVTPDKFVWDYDEGMKVISDGEKVLIFYKELHEADLVELDKLPSLPVSFSFEKLKEKYDIEVIGTVESNHIVKFIPKIDSNIIKEMFITLNDKGVPINVRIVERTNDSTFIKFVKSQINIKISDEVFSTKVPEGVKVREHLK